MVERCAICPSRFDVRWLCDDHTDGLLNLAGRASEAQVLTVRHDSVYIKKAGAGLLLAPERTASTRCARSELPLYSDMLRFSAGRQACFGSDHSCEQLGLLPPTALSKEGLALARRFPQSHWGDRLNGEV